MILEVVIEERQIVLVDESTQPTLQVTSTPMQVVMDLVPQAEAIVPVAFEQRVADLENRSTYRHVQTAPAAIWSINHNLDKYPSVTVKDSAGTTVTGEVVYDDPDNLTITFSAAFSGEAYLN